MAEQTFIYVDNAATTAVSDHVLESMMPYFRQEYGNASSVYALGRRASLALEQARDRVAKVLGAKPQEIFFTSGGSEANNWAIKGVALEQAKQGKKHIITTAIEHHAVLHTVEFLEKNGFEITILPVEKNGILKLETLQKAVREDTALVSVMYANNEIGTIQPIAEIGAFCREHGVLFHTDAVQAIGAVPIDVVAQHIDLLSLSGHKIHAQKGIGALYIRQGVKVPNLIHGGAQERGRRAGTENVAAIVGLATAMEDATAHIAEKDKALRAKSNRLMDGLLTIPRSRLNGDRKNRLCGNTNISFEGIEGESLLLLLDNKGIAASSGSACTSGSLDPSHVLLAIGLPHEVAHGSLRISISEDTTEEDINAILKAVPEAVERLREMSPLWEKIVAENPAHVL